MASGNMEQRGWTELGAIDPKWAIASAPDKRGGRWDDGEFFATGEQVIKDHLQRVRDTGIKLGNISALDFGCGIGRLTRALTRHFESVTGVDVSATMIEQGRHNVPDAIFFVQTDPTLTTLKNEFFDFIVAHAVLQHVGGPDLICRYIGSLAQKLAHRGALVFNVPIHIPFKHRIQPRRRLYAIGRAVGVPAGVLFRAGLSPIRMSAVSHAKVRGIIESHGCRVVSEQKKNYIDGSVGVVMVVSR